MKKKENIIIIVVLVVMILAIVGVSYAAFSYGKTGEKVNSITTGSITMTYTETDNTISLSGALPTTDKTGTVRLNPGEYFDFSVSSEITGDVNINYEISAKKEDGNTIGGEYIKLYLTKINSDGTEEALMVPETYNEETSANDYTGRPSNEMSLYTSSMNSSESNNYRLRMYVDESYNPQGDGGGLTFSVRINVYGKAGDKYVPLTTQKILEDNELQEEKENMFNYASNGNYTNSNYEQLNNPEYVTNGLYSMEDEDGVSYYFRGNVDNNNVQFGEYTSDYYVYQLDVDGIYLYFQSLESCQETQNYFNIGQCSQVKLASQGDKMYWKIVRVNGDGSLRLIYNGTSANPTNNELTTSFIIGISQNANLSLVNVLEFFGYTYDRDTNETDNFIKKEVDTWYENTLGNTIYDSKVSSGRFCNDTSGYNSDEIIRGNYFASYDRLGQADSNFAELNSPSLICPTTSGSYGGSYRLKAGLITADELVLAGESMGVEGDSYLNGGFGNFPYWTMTPIGTSGDPIDSLIWVEYSILFSSNTFSGVGGIRPVINVATDNGFVSGDGTSENPYVIN